MRKKAISLVLIAFLILELGLSGLFSMTVYADSSANDRQKAYIQFASENATVGDTDLSSLTQDEMRIVGVFLSNFYVPWGTQLVETEDDDSSRSQMEDILTNSLSFDSGLASDMVDAVFDMSINSAEKLSYRVRFTADLGAGVNNYVRTLSNVTYYSLVRFWANRGSDSIAFSTSISDYSEVSVLYSECTSMELVYDGNVVFSLTSGGNSAGDIAFTEIMKNMDMSQGYGYNMFAVPLDVEGTNVKGDFDLITDLVSGSDGEINMNSMFKISQYGWDLYVDCFGNIIVDCGVGYQYVVVPACMNPYAWQKDGLNIGEALPLNNLAFLSEADLGMLSKSDSSLTIDLNSENSSLSKLRAVRGNSETSLTNWYQIINSVSSVFGSLYQMFYDIGGMGMDNEFNTQDQILTGKAFGVLSKLDLSSAFVSQTIDDSKTIQDYIMFDTLGLFSSENSDTMVINPYGIFADSSGTALSSGISSGFTNYLSDTKDNTLVSLSSDQQKCFVAGLYTAYVFAYFETDGTSEGGHVNFRFAKDNLPSPGTGVITLTDNSYEEMQGEVLTMLYLFLHPSEGASYVAEWFDKTVKSVGLDLHSKLVGNTSATSSTGSTKYLGTSGYMTTPEIKDISWLNSLFNTFLDNAVFLLVAVMIVLSLYWVAGEMGFQRTVITSIVFAVCLYISPVILSSGVSLGNSLTDSFYSSRFSYWGIVQHEAYIQDLDSALDTDNYGDYLVSIFESQNAVSNTNVVTLRWMCPKKDNYMVNIDSELSESVNSSSLSVLLDGVIRSQVSGEDYTESANKTYLYRSYVDIASYAQYMYSSVGTQYKLLEPLSYLDDIDGYSEGETLYSEYTNYTSGTVTDNITLQLEQDYGFNYNTGTDKDMNKRFSYMNRSSLIADAINVDFSSVDDSYDYFGIGMDNFNFTLADFNDSSEVMNPKQVSLSVFALYSESPFYYLNWNLRDQLRSTSGLTTDYIKSLFLQTSDSVNSYFLNTSDLVKDTDSYGQLRDYLDMRSLFTIVIPYLKAANDVVVEFDDTYGLYLLGDYAVNYITDDQGNMTLDIPSELSSLTTDNQDEYYSFWHDVQVSNMFNMYTPWVDTLYSCSYAEAEEVTVAGVTYVIEDPLNPASYPIERPMVFSRSEQNYYGYSDSQLTEVERLIIELGENCYSELLPIMNYYTFDTDVVLTAVAMVETFEFNKLFSETHFFSSDNVLYPQGFELKNFTFDAYLRLILASSIDADLNSLDDDIYQVVVDDTSSLTAWLIVIVDLTAMWIIPFLRYCLIVLLVVLCILGLTTNCIIDVTDFKTRLKKLVDLLVVPLIQYLCVTISVAYVISLLLSNGNDSVVRDVKYSISLGDPILTLLFVLLFNCILVYTYVRLVLKMISNTKKQGKLVAHSVTGVVAGVAAVTLGSIKLGKSSLDSETGVPTGSGGVGGSGSSGLTMPKLNPNGNNAQERLARRELLSRDVNAVGKFASSPFRRASEKRQEKRAEETKQRDMKTQAQEIASAINLGRASSNNTGSSSQKKAKQTSRSNTASQEIAKRESIKSSNSSTPKAKTKRFNKDTSAKGGVKTKNTSPKNPSKISIPKKVVKKK